VRLHLPIVTHPDVEFFVNGTRMHLGPGEVWSLDTSYPHRVANNSTIWRVHLIVDLELNDQIRRLLPKADVWDKLHVAHFALLCGARGLYRITTPALLANRLREAVRLWSFR
jgi:aspartyl/asparaginyl beta-hydroxylase (cupin superfamily)